MFLNILSPNINKVPRIAGKIKLINQILAAVAIIPIELLLNKQNNNKLTFPLKPNSAAAIS